MLAYKKLKKIFHKNSIISDINSILHWDLSTIMPEKSRKSRVKQLSFLTELKHQILCSSNVNKLFLKVDENELSLSDRFNFREMKKEFKYYSSLPEKLVKKKTLLSTLCEAAWQKAKKKKKFDLVKKELESLIKIVREESKILSDKYDCSPYDSLIKNFEDSYSSNEIEKLFNKLYPFINSTYDAIVIKQKNEKVIPISRVLSKSEQLQISKFFMKKIGFNFKKGRLDQSIHPFCGGGTNDIRITTRTNEYNSFSSFEAVMHETGHALYEQNLPKKWQYQPAGKSGGMALHESQSLLIEMQIMKSMAFQKYFSKIIKKKFNLEGEEWSHQNLFKIFNNVKKSFIRVEADEVTYPLHIILRFNLEKKIFEENLSVDDIPLIWNREFKKLFNMSIDKDSNGCLQDIHWFAGLFGYFPTYTLGALISSQLSYAMREDIINLDNKVSKGNFKDLVNWLKQNVHSNGSLYSTKNILMKSTNSKLDINFYKNYIKKKYLSN